MARIKGLEDKAKKSGISYGLLKKVYDRGMAAWKTGHRPGTTPQQWAFARVNSYITKGKTYHTADKDLRSEYDAEKDYKKKKRLKEFLQQEDCWDGYKQVGMKKGKSGKQVPNCVPEEEDPREKAQKERIRREREREVALMKKTADKQKEKIAKARADSRAKLDALKDKETARKRAERERRSQTEEKLNCGCGQDPCITYGEVEERVDAKKMISKIKGLTKKQIQVLQSIPQSQLVTIVQQLSGLTMGEDFDPFNTIEEALTVQQRMKRGQIARRTAKKRARAAARKRRRMKNASELQAKAMRAARTRLAKRMLGSLSMADLSISQKVNLAKKLEKKKGAIKKLSKRLLPAVRKQEMQRLKKFRERQQNESINTFKDWWSEAVNPAQQAAIAIAKKKSGKYDKDGNKIKKEEPNYNLGDGNCNDTYLELGTDRIRKVYSKDTPGQANESLRRRMANMRRDKQATNRARMRQNPSMDPAQFQNNKFVVSYKNLKRKEDERLVRAFMSAPAAKKFADKANKVDSDGGKYSVYQNNKGVLQSI